MGLKSILNSIVKQYIKDDDWKFLSNKSTFKFFIIYKILKNSSGVILESYTTTDTLYIITCFWLISVSVKKKKNALSKAFFFPLRKGKACCQQCEDCVSC